MWDIIYGQININMWTTSVKARTKKKINENVFGKNWPLVNGREKYSAPA